jgi:large conductance mechanosensitive channel
MWNEFKQFALRGNVVDLAIGIIIGAAFTKIVTSLVEGILMPFVGLFTGRIDFASMFYVLDKSKGIPASLAEAKTNGVPVLAYGQFFNDVISFLIVAFVVFLIVRQVNRLWSKQHPADEAPTTKDCPHCLSTIPLMATRCKDCTAELKG